MPYNRDTHSKSFGGPRDYYNCTGRFYIITHKPTKVDVTSVKTSKSITPVESHNLRDSWHSLPGVLSGKGRGSKSSRALGFEGGLQKYLPIKMFIFFNTNIVFVTIFLNMSPLFPFIVKRLIRDGFFEIPQPVGPASIKFLRAQTGSRCSVPYFTISGWFMGCVPPLCW